MKVEKDWTTASGLRAVVIAAQMGHRCGYVGVPKDHPLFGKDYGDVDADVHGGLTYAGHGDYPVESNLHWFGFDCAHYMDAKDTSIMDEKYLEIHEKYPRYDMEGAVVRDLAFCKRECESLAEQLCVSRK
jgi:hypothetical protein